MPTARKHQNPWFYRLHLLSRSHEVRCSEVTIPKAHEVIQADGTFTNPEIAESVRALGRALVAALQG